MQAKYVVVSGFLGAGKTTAMIALARSIERRNLGRPAILVDDLGAGHIVDAETTASTKILSRSISGDCICYQHENLVDKLHQLVKSGANVLFSDIPGCGIGALDNVYVQLSEKEPGEFWLMPFTCVVDPERIRMIMPEQADINLPVEMKFLLDAQMAEADLIVLNKTDTVTPERRDEILSFIAVKYPQAKLFSMCALTGEGADELADHLLSHRSPAVHRDIGYGSEAFMAAESLMSWYNRRIFMEQRSERPLDFNEVISDIFEGIREGLRAKRCNAPHLKMYASDSGENMTDCVKASLIGVDYPVEYASRLKKRYTALSLIINGRVVADSQDMSDIVDGALDETADRYGLRIKTFFVEAFGMTEEGRGNIGRASKY